MVKYNRNNRRKAYASLAMDRTLTFTKMSNITKIQIILLNAYLPKWFYDNSIMLKNCLNPEQYIRRVFYQQLETYEALEIDNGKYKCPVCKKSTVESFPGMICHTEVCSNKDKLYFQFDIYKLAQKIGRNFATFIALLEEIKENFDAANVEPEELEHKLVSKERRKYYRRGLVFVNYIMRHRRAQRTRRKRTNHHEEEEEAPPPPPPAAAAAAEAEEEEEWEDIDEEEEEEKEPHLVGGRKTKRFKRSNRRKTNRRRR
jgi:hypothetical protein